MADYVLSEAARTDLKNVYSFGYKRFGEQQAERYYDGLIICFGEIAQKPTALSTRPRVRGRLSSLRLDFRKYLLPSCW